MIAIVDYKAGNLTSVYTALRKLDLDARVTRHPQEVLDADRVIFPGVGAAGNAMQNLDELHLRGTIEKVVNSGRPFLGICLGYQVLFEWSDEDGGVECMGLLPGRVKRFGGDLHKEGTNGRPLKIPHMGWNEACFTRKHELWEDVPAGSEFYFVHAYYPQPAHEHVCSTTTYGVEFASGVVSGNVIGFQFHPEKSGRPGLQLLESFCHWQP